MTLLRLWVLCRICRKFRDYKAMLAKYRRKETDPWAVYTLSDFRQRRAQAAGVAIDRTAAGAAAAHD